MKIVAVNYRLVLILVINTKNIVLTDAVLAGETELPEPAGLLEVKVTVLLSLHPMLIFYQRVWT